MPNPIRGLDLMHYMQFAFTPIVRATVTPGEEITPVQYYEMMLHYDVTVEAEDDHDFVFGNIPDPIADVLVTVKSIGCYAECVDGIVFRWGPILPAPDQSPPWSSRAWWCPPGCDEEDNNCSPDDCSENTITFSINYEEWKERFNGTIGAVILWPVSEGCECSGRYVELTIRFLVAEAVHEPDTVEQDLTYPPHHGWATWHTAIPGAVPGVLSKALGEVRVDPDHARTVCYHEWAPPDDPEDKRYAVGGLAGIHQRPAEEEEFGDLAHGCPVRQRIQGMTTRTWTETDCINV